MEARYYQSEAVEAMLACKTNSVAVLPTGSGKSLVLRLFAERFKGKILILSHVKEILEQNFQTLTGMDDIGLYSAGLGVKHIDRVTVAGIQSVHTYPEMFRDFDVVLIDECHMVSDQGMYHSLLNSLGIQYLGLTATPMRLKQGYIYKHGMFDSLIYEASVQKLTKEGYLSKLTTYGSGLEFDTTGVQSTGGDFKLNEMSIKFNRELVTSKIVASLKQYKEQRKHWLIFCIDIDHAEAVSVAMNKIGIVTEAVHSKSPRDQTLLDFKAGKIQAITNVNVLTIGFDFPSIDMVVVLRPTKSPTLHVQMLGRGLRKAPGKDDCLIKDFAGNIKRLGTIGNLQVDMDGAVRKSKPGALPFLKECPDCEKLCAPAVRLCECGHKFVFRHHLSTTAYVEKKDPVWFKVTNVMYQRHKKAGKPDTIRVSYVCGMRVFNEWVLVGYDGYAGTKAKQWLLNRWTATSNPPMEVNEILKCTNLFRKPNHIQVDEIGKYPKIIAIK